MGEATCRSLWIILATVQQMAIAMLNNAINESDFDNVQLQVEASGKY
jgi:hypothetical protein